MSKLIAIGELLIDFIPQQKGKKLKDVTGFDRVAGGAPANVCACVSKLGEKGVLLTQVGKDAFGDYLIDTLDQSGVNIAHIRQTTDALTALAFVSLDQKGERDFSFYRNPSADMLYRKEFIDTSLFQQDDILHFCSVDLIDSPMKEAHRHAIDLAHQHQMIVSFDPNLRFPLWNDLELYKKTIQEFIPLAHLLKISHDELEFITGTNKRHQSIDFLFQGNVTVVIITEGPVGATVYTKEHFFFVQSIKTNVVDTTGAGDAFIGTVIAELLRKKTNLCTLKNDVNEEIISFAHQVSSHVISRYGAIPSMPNRNEL
jgi:fructokinase